MEGFFSPNNILFRILSRICDLFVLHVLWIVCSIPIFTIGASTTALYYTAMKSVKLEDGYVVKRFFKSFKENFRQSTLIWLIMLVIGAFLGVDLYLSLIYKMKPFMLIFTVLLCVYLFILIYVFPLQAKFDNKISVTIRNAFLLSIKYFPWTLLLVILDLMIAYLVYLLPLFMMGMMLIGSSVYAYGTAFIFNKVFKPYLPEEATGSSDEEFHIKEDADTNDDSPAADSAQTKKTEPEADQPQEENETEPSAGTDKPTSDTPPRKLSMADKVNSVASYKKQNEEKGRD